MTQVFQPLEVTNGDTSCVTKNVGKELNAFIQKNFLGFKSCGTVGGFNNQASLELVSIVDVDRLLKGGWNEEITE